jgi:hypothetical protein
MRVKGRDDQWAEDKGIELGERSVAAVRQQGRDEVYSTGSDQQARSGVVIPRNNDRFVDLCEAVLGLVLHIIPERRGQVSCLYTIAELPPREVGGWEDKLMDKLLAQQGGFCCRHPTDDDSPNPLSAAPQSADI